MTGLADFIKTLDTVDEAVASRMHRSVSLRSRLRFTCLLRRRSRFRHFEISTTDPDNDPLAITWKVNGEEVVGETGPAFIFTATDAESDVVSVEVSDGTETIEHRWRIARALRGDFDDNGIVDLIDFFLFASAFGQDGVGELARFNLDENPEINFSIFLYSPAGSG